MFVLDTEQKNEWGVLFQTIAELQYVEEHEDIVSLARQKIENFFENIEEGEWEKEYKFRKFRLVYYPNGLMEFYGGDGDVSDRIILSPWESKSADTENERWEKELKERKEKFWKTLKKKHPMWELQYRLFKGETIKKRKTDIQKIEKQKEKIEQQIKELKENNNAVKTVNLENVKKIAETNIYKYGMYMFNQIIPKEFKESYEFDSFLFTLTKEELQSVDDFYQLAIDKKTKAYNDVEREFRSYLNRIRKEQIREAENWCDENGRLGVLIREADQCRNRVRRGTKYSANNRNDLERLIQKESYDFEVPEQHIKWYRKLIKENENGLEEDKKKLEEINRKIEAVKQNKSFYEWAKEAFPNRFMMDCLQTINGYDGEYQYKCETVLYMVETMKDSTNEEIQQIYQLFIKN